MAGPALSQDYPEQRLEEVTVVAQRVEESAQDTPVSLVSFNNSELETLGIASIADLRAQVPNFLVDQFPSSNQTLRLFIRGVGVADVQITQDPAVGVYLNGVYLARSTGLATEVADLERIEVLRGPQGTLYGRNTTGGALNLITLKPDPGALAFRQTLGTGNRDRFRSRTSLNLPLGERQAIKLAAIYDRADGFIKNGGPGGGFGDRSAEGYRLDWRWLPTGSLSVDYAWDKSRIESHNYTPQAVRRSVPTGTPADTAILSSQRFVRYGSDRFSQLATSVPLSPNDTDIEGHALTLEWQLPALTLKSISAWRQLSDHSYIDFASGASEEYRVDFHARTLGADSAEPLHFDTVRTRVEQDQFSQELQLFGSFSPRWDYVAGLYYFRERADENWFPMHHISGFPLIETGDQADAVTVRAEDNHIGNDALALYGQLSWRPEVLASRLQLSLGWRHSRDQRSVDRLFRQDNYLDYGSRVLGPLESIDFAADVERDFDDNSYSFILEYAWQENLRLYGKYLEAYKSGGFNTRDPDPEFFSRGFDEEKNRTLEAGFKSEFMDRRLRLNTALFYSRFDDLQLNFLLPGSISDTRVLNIGNAELSGLELELVALPWYGLVCSLNYAYLHSEVDPVRDPFTGEQRAFSFPNAPQNTASLNIDYRSPLGRAGQLAANLNYNYVDERDPTNETLYREAYSLLNGRLGLEAIPLAAGSLGVAAWVKNALDEDYVSFAIDNLPHASRAVLWGEPRSWGVDLTYRY